LKAVVGAGREPAGLLVLHNGQLQQQVLDETLAARGVRFSSLAEAVQQAPELVCRALAEAPPRPDEHKLQSLAAALWEGGAFLYLPRGVEVAAPFQVVHWTDTPSRALSRSLVLAEEASSAALVESYASPDSLAESLSSALVEVEVGPAARLSYAVLQERDEQAWTFTALRSEQARDSALTWMVLGLGGRLSRTELTCNLNGQGAEADLLGMVFGDERQAFDLQSLQNHLGDDTRSDLLLQVALRDRARSNFTGMIRVGQEARRTASNQVNHNMLLSGEAKADSDPKLEILNSDVTRCGHGASVGPVDEEIVYYLMTRGLSRAAAERLIIEGFFDPLLSQVPIETLRERLWASIQRRMER
jgi:Fe-S cluster assembly protein SufD